MVMTVILARGLRARDFHSFTYEPERPAGTRQSRAVPDRSTRPSFRTGAPQDSARTARSISSGHQACAAGIQPPRAKSVDQRWTGETRWVPSSAPGERAGVDVAGSRRVQIFVRFPRGRNVELSMRPFRAGWPRPGRQDCTARVAASEERAPARRSGRLAPSRSIALSFPGIVALVIGQHARPQERRQRVACVEAFRLAVERRACPAPRTISNAARSGAMEQARGGGAEVREGDERSARVVEDDAREVPACRGQRRGTELAMNGAEVATIRLEEHARAARLDAEHRGGALGQRSARREQAFARPPPKCTRSRSYTGSSIGMAQPAVQQAPACRQR